MASARAVRVSVLLSERVEILRCGRIDADVIAAKVLHGPAFDRGTGITRRGITHGRVRQRRQVSVRF